jgi:hypothetical protein
MEQQQAKSMVKLLTIYLPNRLPYGFIDSSLMLSRGTPAEHPRIRCWDPVACVLLPKRAKRRVLDFLKLGLPFPQGFRAPLGSFFQQNSQALRVFNVGNLPELTR